MSTFPLKIVTADGLVFDGPAEEIIEGKHDEIPESFFLFAGSIDEVVAKFKGGEGA